MADSSKTEKATAKRLRDERKKGNILQSKDVVIVVSLIGMFCVLRLWFPSMVDSLTSFIGTYFGYINSITDLSEDFIKHLTEGFISSFVRITAPLFLCGILFAAAATVAQTKPVFVWDALKPKFSKLNPIKGFQKLFSIKNLIEVLKGSVKISILFAIIYNFFRGRTTEFIRTLDMGVTASLVYLLRTAFNMVMQIGIAFAVIAVFDIFYQKWEYERNMKMTKHEVKEEYKQLEGDPKIKSKIKSKQMEMAQRRMMQAVPQADVIIKNPTHYAVALKYNIDVDAAPKLIAKGQDELALRIISVGEQNGVHVVENKPLARAIYATTDLGREIQPDFYGVIAEILVQIYKLENKI